MIESFQVKDHMIRSGAVEPGSVSSASAAATVAVGLPLSAGARETITVDQFRTLSARLTGASVTDLAETTAGKLLDGFISMGRGPDLALLAADLGVSGGTLADDVAAAWYSGSYDTSAGLASFGLTNALLWNVLNFTKPPGVCGGQTGYWADAPHS